MNYILLSVMYNINSCEVYCFSNSVIAVYEESMLPGTKSDAVFTLMKADPSFIARPLRVCQGSGTEWQEF